MNLTPSEYNHMTEGMTADLVQMLIEKENLEFSDAISFVYNSDTYKALLKPESMFYYQSPGYVYSYLVNELKTGKMA